MTFINWETRFYFDLAMGDAGGPYPEQNPPATYVPVPTYGNYGGANYSEGTFGGELDISKSKKSPFLSYQQLVKTGDETNDPKDKVDYAFYKHDVLTDLAQTPEQQAAADLALIRDLFRLDQKHQLTDPEASLYAGLATLAVGALLLEDNPDPFLTFRLLPYLENALENVVTGFEGLEPEELIAALAWLTGPLGNTAPGAIDILADADLGEPINSILDFVDAYLDGLNSGLPQVVLVQSSYDFA